MEIRNSAGHRPANMWLHSSLWRWSGMFRRSTSDYHTTPKCADTSVFKTLPLMTLVFGRLVNDFNDWGRGAASPVRLQAAVNKNA
jgi:hypothetical protein